MVRFEIPAQSVFSGRRFGWDKYSFNKRRIVIGLADALEMGVVFAGGFALRVIFRPHVEQRVGVFAIEFAFHDAFANMRGADFADEQVHAVVEGDLIDDVVFDVADRFADQRHGDFRRRYRGELGRRPLVDIVTGNVTGENHHFHHLVGGRAHDELAALQQEIVGQSFLLNRHDHARRLGAGGGEPHGGQKV